MSKEFSQQEKEIKKEFKEEKATIEEKVAKTTDVEMVVVGNIEVKEEKPSLITRLTRKVKKMFGGEEVEVDEEYDEHTSVEPLSKFWKWRSMYLWSYYISSIIMSISKWMKKFFFIL